MGGTKKVSTANVRFGQRVMKDYSGTQLLTKSFFFIKEVVKNRGD